MIYKILNCFSKITTRLSEKTRSKIRTGLYFLLFFVALLYAASVLDGVHLLIKCLIGVGLMGLIILFTIDGTIKKVKWNKPIVIVWFAIGFFQLISGIFVSLEYLPMTMIWIVAFPTLFLVWNNRKDYDVLFKEVAIAGNICFVFMSILSITLYPMNAVRYGGFLNNPNGMGQWAIFAFPLIVFLLCQEKTSRIKKWFYFAELALVALLCFASKGRTAMLAVGLMVFVFAAQQLVLRKDKLFFYLKQSWKFLLCAVLVWAMCLTVNLIPQAIENARPETPIIDQTPGGTANPDDPTIGQNPDDPTNPGQTPTPPAAEKTGVGAMINNVVNRILGLDKAGTSLNDYSSGRIGIWIESLEVMNYLGHPSREHIVTDRNGDVGNNIHNTILQWCYNNGIIAGLLFAVMMILSLLSLLKRSFHKENRGGIIGHMLIIHVGFACTSLFTSLNLPFLYLIEFLYYLSYAVVFDNNKENL